MQSFLLELRTTLRKLRQSPGFATIAVLTLAVGIGANSAIFSIVNAVVLRPLPYPEPDRLVALMHTAPGLDLPEMPQSPATFLRYRDHARLFEGIALFSNSGVALTGDVGPPERVEVTIASPALFSILGVAQQTGRLFVEEDARPGAPPVVLLAHSLFEQRFGGDPEVVGRSLAVDGQAREVVGVLPRGFSFPDPGIDLYVPATIDPANAPLGSFSALAIGRLGAGVSLEEAETELDALITDLPSVFPEDSAARVLANAGFSAFVRPYREMVLGDVSSVLWLLLGSVGLVLLIACANVTNLFLVRTEGRQREIAVRTALGASRAGLVRSFVTESCLLGLLGGVFGLLLAVAGLRVLVRLEPGNIPRLDEIGIDGGVLLFTFGLSLFAGLLFGLLPALRSATPRLSLVLKEGGRSNVGRERHRARHLLAATQIALALVLLVACGLMVRTFAALSRVDPGFRAEGLLTFRIHLPEREYADGTQVASFHQELLDRLEALPGVTSAGAVSALPLADQIDGAGHAFEDFPREEDAPPPVLFRKLASEGYFDTMGIPLLEGRTLTRADHEERRQVALVNRAVAEHYWPGKSPLGRRIAPGRVDEDDDEWYTIVGVVGDVKDAQLNRPPRELVYYPMAAGDPESAQVARGMSFALRTDGDPRALVEPAQRTVWAADPDLPIAPVETMTARLREARARWSFTLALLAIAAAMALLLGSIGIYGVISYLVTQRTAELGLRMALGARGRDLTGMVLRQGLALALAGIAPGIVAALFLTRSMSAILFEVRPFDPSTFVAAPLLLLAVALVACWLPAARAGRLHPVEALRHE
jgi:predicted permease